MTKSDDTRFELFLKEREQLVRERQKALQLISEETETEMKRLVQERSDFEVEKRRFDLEKRQMSVLKDLFKVERMRFENETIEYVNRIESLKKEMKSLDEEINFKKLEVSRLSHDLSNTPSLPCFEDQDHLIDLREAALVAAIARLQQRELEFAEESARERRRLELEAERLARKSKEILSNRDKLTIRN